LLPTPHSLSAPAAATGALQAAWAILFQDVRYVGNTEGGAWLVGRN